jgi:hypothetical protein
MEIFLMFNHKFFVIVTLLISGFGLSVIYPSLPTASCLTPNDVIQAHARSREGISAVCNETIRQAQVNDAARMRLTSRQPEKTATADEAAKSYAQQQARQRVVQ